MVSKVGIIVELANSSEVYIRKQQEDFTLSDDIGNQIQMSKEDWKGVIGHFQTLINHGGYEENPLWSYFSSGEEDNTHNTTAVNNLLPPEQDDIIDVTKMVCFDEIESVIGREQAIKELERVVAWDWDAMRFDPKYSVIQYLESAFTWDATPQGDKFWCDIAEGKTPY